jgi:EAL domain-containing protein (putative c-di-GMP-specific phosphodiesterase class I)
MRQWHDQGFGWVRTAINLAPVTFLDPELAPRLTALLAHYQVPTHTLELEVTERLSIQDDAVVAETMARLDACGVLLAMDDFGTGASSLSALRHLPADALKVDQSFVRGMLYRPQDRAIVAAIVALGRELGLRVVAEGVETEAEARMLSSLQVEELQGFWAARPQPAQAIEQLLLRRRVLDPVGLQLGRLQDAARADATRDEARAADSPTQPAPFTPSRYEGITTVF